MMGRSLIWTVGSALILQLSFAVGDTYRPKPPIYVITYYDRNGDGVVDLELHRAPGYYDIDWGLLDRDFTGEYDTLFVDSAELIQTKVHIKVPGGVPITKEVPKDIRIP